MSTEEPKRAELPIKKLYGEMSGRITDDTLASLLKEFTMHKKQPVLALKAYVKDPEYLCTLTEFSRLFEMWGNDIGRQFLEGMVEDQLIYYTGLKGWLIEKILHTATGIGLSEEEKYGVMEGLGLKRSGNRR